MNAQLIGIKAQYGHLQVVHLGAIMTADDYAAMERGYRESKEVVLPEALLAGDVTDEAISELCNGFSEMRVLRTSPGAGTLFGIRTTMTLLCLDPSSQVRCQRRSSS